MASNVPWRDSLFWNASITPLFSKLIMTCQRGVAGAAKAQSTPVTVTPGIFSASTSAGGGGAEHPVRAAETTSVAANLIGLRPAFIDAMQCVLVSGERGRVVGVRA
jgi:hypothetical protein